jgi:glycerol-3-phosphate acyltransferase PlsY
VLALPFVLAAIGGYLLGSIPFGLVIVRAAGLGDVRAIGSGNIGATNVLRTGRKDLALATLLLDAGKAAIALELARWLSGGSPNEIEMGLTAGACAFLGHCYPVWLGFKGGKGVATYFGLLLFGLPPLGVVVGVIWLAMAMIFRYSSLASLTAACMAPVLALVGGYSGAETGFLVLLAILIVWTHRANIARLRAGAEPRIGEKKETAPTDASPSPPAEPPASAQS